MNSKKRFSIFNLILFLFLASLLTLIKCNYLQIEYPESRCDAVKSRFITYEYLIVPFNNNLMLPAEDFWKYVHSKIDDTGYVKTKESWAERLDGDYLAQVWVYYEWIYYEGLD